jgi:threonine/homoserine/homoserine lactone efflux protein
MAVPSFAPLFLLTVLVASITPGPSMLLALDHGVRHGPRRAVATALGNVAATALQAGVSLAGLGVLIVRSAAIFAALRYAGAAYLAWCGLRMILARDADPGAAPGRPRRGLFLQALLVTLGNPKAVVFFTALYPQFIGATLTPGRAAFMLGATLIITFLCMMTYAAAGDRLRALLARRRARRAMNAAFGLSFIGLGVGLALEDR